MTDRLNCPDCGGTGEQLIGPVRVLCYFCRGYGYVGDDNEPAERGEVEESTEPPPVWDQVGADDLPGCSVCLGTGRVIGLDGNVEGGTASTMVEGPCPACSVTTP